MVYEDCLTLLSWFVLSSSVIGQCKVTLELKGGIFTVDVMTVFLYIVLVGKC